MIGRSAWGQIMRIFWGTALSVSALLSCSMLEEASDWAPGGTPGGPTDGGSGGSDNGWPGDPPELELEESFRAPVVTGSYLWTVNPESHRVALIDGRTLEIRVLEAGYAPTYVAALPPGETEGGALIINEKGQDVSFFFFDQDPSQTERVSLSSLKKPVHPGANAWQVGATGRVAIAWTRSAESGLNSLDGHQDITIYRLRGKQVESSTLSVGFWPSQVFLSADESTAYVVSSPGISVIDLNQEGGPRVVRELFLPQVEGRMRWDVGWGQGGRYALVRSPTSAEIFVIDTESGAQVSVQLPRKATDLDVSADGSFALVVLRGLLDGSSDPEGLGGAGGESEAEDLGSEVALLPLPGIFSAPEEYELLPLSGLVGSASLSEDGTQAVLYSNAIEQSSIWILDLATRGLRQVELRAPVRAALLSPQGEQAVVILSQVAQSQAQGGFALVPLQEDLPARIVGTEAQPSLVSLAGDASSALITAQGSSPNGNYVSYLARFPSLQVDRIALSSEPLASGLLLEAGRGFISQKHSAGRISFVDLETAQVHSLTGFELSGEGVQR